mgnify:CR=1 FL=1
MQLIDIGNIDPAHNPRSSANSTFNSHDHRDTKAPPCNNCQHRPACASQKLACRDYTAYSNSYRYKTTKRLIEERKPSAALYQRCVA